MDKGRAVLRGRPGQGPCQDWLINGGPQGAPCLFSALVLLQLLTKPALKRLPWKHNIIWHRSAHWALPREGHIVLLAWLGHVSWEGKLSEACGTLSSTFGRTCLSHQHCLTQVGQHISFLSHHLCPLSSLNQGFPSPQLCVWRCSGTTLVGASLLGSACGWTLRCLFPQAETNHVHLWPH